MSKKTRKAFMKHVFTWLSVVGLIGVVFSGCAMYDPSIFGALQDDSKPEKKMTSEAQITLAWDPPSTPVQSYNIYYRIHDEALWNLLAEIPAAAEPLYTISIDDLGPGTYDFGISAVDQDDNESALHTSLDITADPKSGWYLSWTDEWW